MLDDESPAQSPALTEQAAPSDDVGGRKGGRSRLGRAFLQAVQADFEAHGVGVVARIREEKPETYLKLVASILPKDINVNAGGMDELSDEQLLERIRTLDAAIRPLLNAKNVGKGARRERAPRAKR
ncbi:hypothetical protein PYH37_004454 [Sinorhizobium numidicum]|uniref:Uncharacterized protein n=1 Tax=Sinorhizobium numidicum TaxID=680248 RepID=A0ABY8CW23_9HYPH|nr:hypothetical protein [Sinorhizobium numidicum]WEX76175.1 hypothetical protein PYH37_004454 [Sinorhizobium numidicum]WEX82834.1 hypothetical protein PYH38_005166 [Sinorhizobium numidicum]